MLWSNHAPCSSVLRGRGFPYQKGFHIWSGPSGRISHTASSCSRSHHHRSICHREDKNFLQTKWDLIGSLGAKHTLKAVWLLTGYFIRKQLRTPLPVNCQHSPLYCYEATKNNFGRPPTTLEFHGWAAVFWAQRD